MQDVKSFSKSRRVVFCCRGNSRATSSHEKHIPGVKIFVIFALTALHSRLQDKRKLVPLFLSSIGYFDVDDRQKRIVSTLE